MDPMDPEAVKQVLEKAQRTLEHLEAEIERLDKEIQGKVPLHVKRKWKRCGKRGCSCYRGRGHGPYLYGYLPDEEVRQRRREKKGRGSTRKEIYLGKDFVPPEGWVKPAELKRLLVKRNSVLERKERIMRILARIQEEVLKLAYGRT